MTNRDTDKKLDSEARRLFLAALLERGWKLPTTPEEVAFTDNIELTDIAVPDSLKSASAVFEEIVKPRTCVHKASQSVDVGVAEKESTVSEEWSGSLCPLDPANYWIDDDTGERVSAETGERMSRAETEQFYRSHLECLRSQLNAECISYDELHELQSLVEYIDEGDVQLLEAAGVPECAVNGTLYSHIVDEARQHAADTGEADFEPGDLAMCLKWAIDRMSVKQKADLYEFFHSEVVP